MEFLREKPLSLRDARNRTTPNALIKEIKQIKELNSILDVSLFSARVAYGPFKFRPTWIVRTVKARKITPEKGLLWKRRKHFWPCHCTAVHAGPTLPTQYFQCFPSLGHYILSKTNKINQSKTNLIKKQVIFLCINDLDSLEQVQEKKMGNEGECREFLTLSVDALADVNPSFNNDTLAKAGAIILQSGHE